MGLVGIGEFARMSRLSPKALRRYDELGLLPPARVDPGSGYRWYDGGQLDRARLVSSLRRIGVPLAQIAVIVELEAAAAAELVRAFWAAAEADHAGRAELAGHLVDRLSGKRSVRYEVATRQMPARTLLCLHRYVDGEAGAWALGKEFVGIFRERAVPRMEGRVGAAFVIYHGQVNEDSDGPLEWCRPVPDQQADEMAARFPELTMRTESGHQEAFVHLGSTQLTPPQWQLISERLHIWASEQHRQPAALGVRVTFLATPALTADSVPDCDFAVPLR